MKFTKGETVRRIYGPRDSEDPLLETNKVVPHWHYLWDDYRFDLNEDADLIRWFRGVPGDRIRVEDLLWSQDKRYAQLFLYSMARSMHAKTIVEIGVADGSTTWPLLKAASETGGIVYSVDPSYSEMADSMVHRCGYQNYWNYYIGLSDDFFQHEGKELSIEFGFIDGDHSYMGVYNDLKNIIDRLVPGGIVVLDEWYTTWDQDNDEVNLRDRSPASASGGTSRAICDLLPQYPRMDMFPLNWGMFGKDRFKEWTEPAVVMLRKRSDGEANPYKHLEKKEKG